MFGNGMKNQVDQKFYRKLLKTGKNTSANPSFYEPRHLWKAPAILLTTKRCISDYVYGPAKTIDVHEVAKWNDLNSSKRRDGEKNS